MLRFVAVMLLVCLCGAVCAVPNLNGASGGIQLPDASVTCVGDIDVAAAYVRSEGTSDLAERAVFVCHGTGYNARVLGGVFNRVELGGGYLGISKSIGDANAWTVGAKWQFMDKPESGVKMAVGASYRGWSSDLQPFSFLDYEIDLPNVFTAYVVLDKTWPLCDESDWQTTTSIGVMYDRFSATDQRYFSPGPPPPNVSAAAVKGFSIGDRVPSKSFVRPIFAVKLAKGGWSFIGEYKPRLRKSDFFYAKDIWSAAVRKEFCGGLAITTGVTSFNLPYTKSDPGFFFDLSYKFGK